MCRQGPGGSLGEQRQDAAVRRREARHDVADERIGIECTHESLDVPCGKLHVAHQDEQVAPVRSGGRDGGEECCGCGISRNGRYAAEHRRGGRSGLQFLKRLRRPDKCLRHDHVDENRVRGRAHARRPGRFDARCGGPGWQRKIRHVFEIPFALEQRAGRPALRGAFAEIMRERILPGRRHFGVFVQVPIAVEPRVRIETLGGADLQIVRQRIEPCGPYVRILLEIPLALEQPVRRPARRRARAQIMRKRIDAGGRDLRILRKIPGAIEQRVGIAAFEGARAQVVAERIDAGRADVGILVEIPSRIEQLRRSDCGALAPALRPRTERVADPSGLKPSKQPS